MLSRNELEAISNDVSLDTGSREKARQLLAATEIKDDGTEYVLADAWRTAHAVGQISNEEKAMHFANARKTLKNHQAFSEAAEAEPAKANWIEAWGKNPFTGESYARSI
jgi:hypothetical protein